ncbi:MAG: GNAT family N-acetyltransferase [Candidatus Arcticimaribacter sp.]
MTTIPSPILREATGADLPVLLQFEQDLIAYERPFAPNLKKGKISYYDLAAYIEDPAIRVIVAEVEGQVVGSGYALIRENKAYKAPQHYVYLGFMYVIPEYRGQGINGLIMIDLIHWGKAQGHTEVQLEVYAENESAIKAYAKAGLVPEILTMRSNNIPPENQ